MTGISGRHAERDLIAAYVAGDTIPSDVEWGLDAHLENCATCRKLVADTVVTYAPEVDALLTTVWAQVSAAAVGAPAPVRSRLLRALRTWAPPSQLLWLLLGVLMALAALGLDMLDENGRTPSLVLLVAPVAPLLGVAAAWTRDLDPMGELTVSSPRAGLQLVLRRTAAVLVVMIPVLAVAGAITNVSLAVCLLPCLAFTAGALALGTVIGVGRASVVLGVLWVLAVILPSVFTARLSVVLAPASLPVWALAVAVAAVVTAVRARMFTTLPTTNLP